VNAVDPDPNEPGEGWGRATRGGRDEPASGDPPDGGRRGQAGETAGIASDEPDDGGPPLGPGGGRAAPESDAPPVADPGPGE
jgi:hypothetical protein